VVGFTTGSRGEVPGKRKPMIREHDDNDKIINHNNNNNNNNNSIIYFSAASTAKWTIIDTT
jgi:hypothetical protein